jgi:hypothetical protein
MELKKSIVVIIPDNNKDCVKSELPKSPIIRDREGEYNAKFQKKQRKENREKR